MAYDYYGKPQPGKGFARWNFGPTGLPGQPRTDPNNWSMGTPGRGWYTPDLAPYAPQQAAPATPQFDPYADPGYAGLASSNLNALTHAQAEHDYQYGVGAQNFGISSTGDTLGEGSGGYNPYSQASILKRNYDVANNRTNIGMAAAGHLYGGSRLNALADNTYGYGQQFDALKRGATGFYHGQDLNLQGVQDQGIAALAQALGPALANFLASQGGGK